MAREDFDSLRPVPLQHEVQYQRPLPCRAQGRHPGGAWPGGLIEFYGMDEGGGSCMLAAHQFPGQVGHRWQAAENHDMRVNRRGGVELPFR